MGHSHKGRAAIALLWAAFGWALAPIFIRQLSLVYDPNTQNFLRYASAVAPLIVVSLVWFPDDFRTALRGYKPLLCIAALNLLQQHVWTVGCAGSTATTAQLISKLSIVFVIVFSFFLFHEERAVIKSPIFTAGTLLSFVGAAAVISDNPASMIPTFNMATCMLLLTAVLWAVYTVWAKHLVMNIHPVPMFTVLSIFTTIGFGILAPLTGHPSMLVTAGWHPILIGVVSGLIPIALAHPSFHYAQKNLGSALCSSVSLFNPLVTYAIAMYVFPDEHMVLTQWIGASVLLAGTLLVIYAGKRVARAKRAQESGPTGK